MTETGAQETQTLEAITVAAGTDIGRRREENQDSFGLIDGNGFRFFLVADGMGGVKGGAIASQLAVATAKESFGRLSALDSGSIQEVVAFANQTIYQRGQSEPGLESMGTTFVALGFTGTLLYVVNVGDSRAYRFRGGRVRQLTEDHTLVRELLRSGAITPDQAKNHPVSHMLTRSLGPTPEVQCDCVVTPDGPARGDVYLLCSDGLYNLVKETELLSIVSENSLDDAVQKLIDLANERGGTDNITVILVRVGDAFPRGPEEFPPEPEPVPEAEVKTATEHEAPRAAEPSAPATDSIDWTRMAAANQRLRRDDEPAPSPVSESAPPIEQPTETEPDAPKKEARIPILTLIALIVFCLAYAVGRYQGGGPTSASPSAANPFASRLAEVSAARGVVFPDLRSESLVGPLASAETAPSVAGRPEGERPSAVAEQENLAKRRDVLLSQIADIDERIAAFGKPLSGRWAGVLESSAVDLANLKRALDAARAELDTATRKLSVWVGRKRRLENVNPIDIASEVAAVSPAVREKKELFEKASWDYLNRVEEWRYNPTEELSRDVANLAAIRSRRLQELTDLVRQAIDEEVDHSQQQVSELSWKRDGSQSQIDALNRDIYFVKVLMSDSPTARAQKKAELERERDILSSELQAIERVLKAE